MKKLYKSFFLSLFLMACTDSLLASAKPFFVISGGFSSCSASHQFGKVKNPLGAGISIEMKHIINQLQIKNREKVDYVFLCFDFSEKMKIISSESPREIISGNRNMAFYYINKFWKANPEREAIMIGHSHGGSFVMWLAKKAAEFDRSTSLMVTIDGIGESRCGLKSRSIKGCKEAPQFANRDVRLIRSRVNNWYNIYQRIDPILQSDRIPEADFNIRLANSGGHRDLDQDTTVINLIKNLVDDHYVQ